MDSDIITVDVDMDCPFVVIPKTCSSVDFEEVKNLVLNLNISTADIDGNSTSIYSGTCNMKILDKERGQSRLNTMDYSIENYQPTVVTEHQNPSTSFMQSQVWIDPEKSPNRYLNDNYCSNNYSGAQEHYSVHTHMQTSQITVEKQQCRTYITQKVYNCEESIRYSPIEEYEHKKFKKVNWSEPLITQNNCMDLNTQNLYEDDEIQCGVFLSQLPEEILNETENRLREERRFNETHSQNNALKQLMSPNIQASSKQTKTILFLGHDASHGQTVHKINMNDTYVKCVGSRDLNELDAGDDASDQMKYQCEKCQKVFDQLSLFKQHMCGNHNIYIPGIQNESHRCTDCGKVFKNRDKLEHHLDGHGNPELECDQCGSVLASKVTLRNHRKLHFRKHRCDFCPRSFLKKQQLCSHALKTHCIFYCDKCEFHSGYQYLLEEHVLLGHVNVEDSNDCESRNNSGTDFTNPFMEDDNSTGKLVIPVPNDGLVPVPEDQNNFDETFKKRNLLAREHEYARNKSKVTGHDDEIAFVMSNEMFLMHAKKCHHYKKREKVCEVCLKHFDRIADLKRHLIEHVIRSTLAKNPVSANGTLYIQCEICRGESFTKIEKYKAHLREHAKLTLYKCTFCNKCFSDSSNFSKHKKIHGDSYMQCDLCQRKFNSKKMIEMHMEYHKRNAPIPCQYCDKIFYFKSMLYKHMKTAHGMQFNRYRCKFCHGYFKSLKEKWDHEWLIHSVRKMIVDCLVCNSKFRKYSELKKHCWKEHQIEVPKVRRLLSKRTH